MYTQCSKCETVFKLSAEVLRVAGGQVRCGRCGEVFNALARLAEDSAGFSTGESPLELETRADSILESVTTVQTAQTAAKDNEEFAPPGVEIAHLEILDFEDVEDTDRSVEDADRSMEFTLPPGELDRIFVESKKSTLPPIAPPGQPQQPAQPLAQTPAQQSAQPGAQKPAHPEARTEPAPDAEPDAELPLHPESAAADAAAEHSRVYWKNSIYARGRSARQETADSAARSADSSCGSAPPWSRRYCWWSKSCIRIENGWHTDPSAPACARCTEPWERR